MIRIRNDLRPGDIGEIIRIHGVIYAREYNLDHTFEAYVAEALAKFAMKQSPREQIWIAERGQQIVGCIAIVESDESAQVAQLRWYLVNPAARGAGLGSRLLDESIAFSRAQGYAQLILWTVNQLIDAAKLYVSRGFELVESQPTHRFGVETIEQKYALRLTT